MKYFFSNWRELTIYQRFESLIALVLRLTVSLIILAGLYRLITAVVSGLVFGALNPLEPEVFHTIFGDILTVLIALEFNHTLNYLAAREQSVIQTKIVLLISILALARKLIVLDLNKTSSNQLLGLAAVTLSLGITYWLMRERDDRLLPLRAQRKTEEASPDTKP
ncbi:MAG: hypothetical protein JWQ71_2252 [Pedosphaera sp.]|nr:hypothetical protein [Pedosphaera sp.]